jgi:SAM-dependent methyltransferase
MSETIKEQKILAERANNYNRLIISNFNGYFGNNILEVGCSLGNLIKFFINKKKVIGIDVNEEALNIAKKRYNLYKNFKTLKVDISKKASLKLKKYNIDTIFSSNVIEHIKEDNKAFKNIYTILKKKGRFLLLVPGVKFLYGTMDSYDGHYRRYSKKELSYKLKKAGFIVEKIKYINFFGIFGWYINGKILNRKILPENQMGIFDKIVPFLFKFEKLVGPFIGLSLIAICKKE